LTQLDRFAITWVVMITMNHNVKQSSLCRVTPQLLHTKAKCM